MTITGALVTTPTRTTWRQPGLVGACRTDRRGEELLAKLRPRLYVHKAEREFLPGLGSDLVKVDHHDTLRWGGCG